MVAKHQWPSLRQMEGGPLASPPESRPIFLNGIDGATGGYLSPPMTEADLDRLAQLDTADSRPLGRRNHKGSFVEQGLAEGLDPRRLEEAGWGVVFAEGSDPQIRAALEPLLRHRKARASRLQAENYREMEYRPGESKLRFLARHGAGPGPVNPQHVPYYLLLVGEPETIPFRFQYQLDVQYAVGRLCFDTAEEYACYAESVLAAENGLFLRARRASFFGVRNEGDPATEACHDLLAAPLAEQMRHDMPGWEVEEAFGPQATKKRLRQLLGGDQAPGILLTASHGLGFRRAHPAQRDSQGALVCQDWAGPQEPADKSFLAAEDLSAAAGPAGLLAFFFACYSAGTPAHNNFVHRGESEPSQLTERSFVARLPQRLLAHPRGGALAVIGHVDRAWTYSFNWPLAGVQREVFASTLRRLMHGYPIGAAMEYFNQRYAELEVDLAVLRSGLQAGDTTDMIREGGLWTARNDARNFVVLGDPAVRLAVEPMDGASGST